MQESFLNKPNENKAIETMSVPVIVWGDAMQQCGDDEEFLLELLGDLKAEAEQQLANIGSVIANPQGAPFEQIMRSAHMIKGASANLMCAQMQQASLRLEDAARVAHQQPQNAAAVAKVQEGVALLQQAVQQYVAFLQTKGL